MARFCPLFSSSSGNCIYIGSGNTNILIDCGVSAKKVSSALESIGLGKKDISAIFITHEHSDHICGLHAFAAKSNIPIYTSAVTFNALKEMDSVCKDIKLNIIEDYVDINGMIIKRFATVHDCDGSSGYRIDLKDGHSFAVCTDTGIITPEIKENLFGCQLVMIESNHDVNMLQNGPYPPQLKMRIISDKGHLSNGTCAKLLPELIKKGTTRIILGHLSKNNNLPSIAATTSRSELLKEGFIENQDYILYVAPPENAQLISL